MRVATEEPSPVVTLRLLGVLGTGGYLIRRLAGCTEETGPIGVIARTIDHFDAASRYREGMARPRLYDEPRIGLALRLPKTMRDELQRVADTRDVSVNFLVTKAIGEYLRGHPTDTLDFDTRHGESVLS